MKFFKVILILLVASGISLYSCGNKAADARKEQARESLGNPTPPAPAATPTTPEPAQNAAGVWHYTCSNGCPGGAGSAVSCASCGATLVHNTAYHNNTGTTSNTNNPINLTTTPSTPPIQPTLTPPTQEPAQNAAGVWHYTCSNGCSGGAGSAIACASCGSKLAHNQAYHN